MTSSLSFVASAGTGIITRKLGNYRHGHCRGDKPSRTYLIWRAMLSRATNPNDPRASHYSGRGIGVTDRWLSFHNFLADMGEAPARLSLDRIDNDGHYEPSNCRWVSMAEQNRNKRSNVFVELPSGERMLVVDAAARFGMRYKTLYFRVTHGWDKDRIFGQPVRKYTHPKRAA